MACYSEMSGCGLAGIVNRDGKKISGKFIYDSITSMKERGNGMGAGFAAYGIYPEMAEYYAFHVMLEDKELESEVSAVLHRFFKVVKARSFPQRAFRLCSKKQSLLTFLGILLNRKRKPNFPWKQKKTLLSERL